MWQFTDFLSNFLPIKCILSIFHIVVHMNPRLNAEFLYLWLWIKSSISTPLKSVSLICGMSWLSVSGKGLR